MNTKSNISIVLTFFMLLFSTFVSADTVTKVNIRGQVANSPSPQESASFQLASAPGVWIYTGDNSIANIVVGMAAVTGGIIDVSHAYNASNGVEEVTRISATDVTAGGVQSVILWDNSTNNLPRDTLGVNFAYLINTNTNNCFTSSAEQAALVTRALFSHLPLKASAYKGYIYDGGQLVQVWFCRIYV